MDNVFIGFQEIAGRYGALSEGFKKLDIDVCFARYKSNKFYNYDTTSGSYLVDKYLILVRSFSGARLLGKLVLAPFVYSLFPFFFGWAILNFQNFIFGFGESFLSILPEKLRNKIYWIGYLDLAILKLFKKNIVFQYHGSDSRPPYLNGSYIEYVGGDISKIRRHTELTFNRIRYVEKYADHIINIPPQGFFHSRNYLLRTYTGLPTLLDSIDQVKNKETNSKIKIVHAPSNPLIKGTDSIRLIIQELSSDYNIEFIELVNKPNEEVIEIIKEADIVIDQLYCDFGLAGLATEASFLGKPVIIGGHSSTFWRQFLPEADLPPTIYCKTEKVKEELESLLQDPNKRYERGQKQFDFVKQNHTVQEVARKFESIFSNNFPEKWSVNPYDIKELCGGFFYPPKNIKEIITDLLVEFGEEALFLEDKPQLKQDIINFATS